MKIKSFAITCLLTAGVAGSIIAQELKLGYTNADYILSLMPEAKQIQAELDSYEKQLDNQLQAKIKGYQTKGQEYQNLQPDTNELIRKDMETEIVNLQNSIQSFQQQAQQSIVQKRAELLQPAYDKIQKTISEVAEENGYSYIFSTDTGNGFILLYAVEEDNISNLILKKMGITPPETE